MGYQVDEINRNRQTHICKTCRKKNPSFLPVNTESWSLAGSGQQPRYSWHDCQIIYQKNSESFDENWQNGGCVSKIRGTQKTPVWL